MASKVKSSSEASVDMASELSEKENREVEESPKSETLMSVEDQGNVSTILSREGRTDQDICIWIGKAAGVFNTLRLIWRSTKLSLNTKLRIFNSNVKSVLFYVRL